SPGPARRRPWRPCMTVVATRRASRISRGIAAANVAPSPTARCTTGRSWEVRRGSNAIRLSDPRFQARNHPLDAFALRARGESERHAVFEYRLGEIEHVVDRRREAL